jgi:hypothetical protein
VEDISEFRGKVTRKPFGKGSKSEHLAVVLETDGGDLVLRRPGGNPIRDPELEQLVGKTISARGRKIGNLLYVLQCAGIENENRS